MGITPAISNNLPRVNIITTAAQVINTATQGRRAYHPFLNSDQPGTVFIKEIRVVRGGVEVVRRSKKLAGYGNLNRLLAATVERKTNGTTEKVMYGWETRRHLGWLHRACSAHIVARKANGEWKTLEEPEEIFGPGKIGRSAKQNAEMIKYLLRDTKDEPPFKAPWNVITRKRRRGKVHPSISKPRKKKAEGYLSYKYHGQPIFLRGFTGYAQVFRVVRQLGDRKIADFYTSEEDYKKKEGYLGSFCLAKKSKRKWEILLKPEIITPIAGYQERDIELANLLNFVLHDQPEDETFIRERWNVDSNGHLSFGGNHRICGFKSYAKQGYVYAEIRQKGNYKVATFWENRDAKESGKKPIRQNVKIAKKEEGEWKKLEETPTQRAQALKEVNKYEEFVLSDQPDKRLLGYWCLFKRGRGKEVDLQRTLAKKVVRFTGFTKLAREKKLKKIFSVTYEVAGCLKIVEFYPTRSDYKPSDPNNLENCIKSAVIAYKDRSGSWQPFKGGALAQKDEFLEDLLARVATPTALERARKFRERHPVFAEAAINTADRQANETIYQGFLGFVHTDQPENRIFILDNWRVHAMGTVSCGNDLEIHGFDAYIEPGQVCAEIRQIGNSKFANFWASREDMEHGAPPIYYGVEIAIRIDGIWQMIANPITVGAQPKTEDSEFEKIVLHDQKHKRLYHYLPLLREEGNPSMHAEVSLAGKYMRFSDLEIHAEQSDLAGCCSVTYEVGNRIKIMELYPTESAYRSGAKPIKAAIVAFKGINGEWKPYRGDLDKPNEFLADLLIQIQDAEAIIGNAEIRSRYPGFTKALVGAAGLERNYDLIASINNNFRTLHGAFSHHKIHISDYLLALAGLLDEAEDLKTTLLGDPLSETWLNGRYHLIARAHMRATVLMEINRVLTKWRMFRQRDRFMTIIQALERHFPPTLEWAKPYMENIVSRYHLETSHSIAA